jgi:hypothetical protein
MGCRSAPTKTMPSYGEMPSCCAASISSRVGEHVGAGPRIQGQRGGRATAKANKNKSDLDHPSVSEGVLRRGATQLRPPLSKDPLTSPYR